MLKKIKLPLMLCLIFLLFQSCGRGAGGINKTKENKMAFEIKNIEYPVMFGNLQRNSLVPVSMKSKWSPVWVKNYLEINDDYAFTPYCLIVKDNNIGVRYDSEMLIFDTGGNLKYQMPLSGSGSVIFGDTALAYFLPSNQLVFQDYEFNKIGEAGIIPKLDEWGDELLMRPTLDDVLAVVQYSGGPMREPKKYYAYKYNRPDGYRIWFQEFEGVVNIALLSNDEKKLLLIQQNEVIVIDATSGDKINSFKPEIDLALSASLDLNDNLIIHAKKNVDEKPQILLMACSLDGKELWSLPMNEPNELQPPACDKSSRIFIIDGLQLLCIKDGEIDWTAILKPAERNYLTITADNHAVVINGSLLALFAPDGEKLFERLITKTDDQFYAPPALDKEGHIFVAGKKALYCFE